MGKRPKTPEDSSTEYDDVLKAVAGRMREARQKAGLTQKELAAKIDLGQSYVFMLESGTANITLRTLAKMADVFGIGVRDLLPESSLTAPSTTALALLHTLFERVAAVLVERHSQDERRFLQEKELLTEIKAFADLRFSLEQALEHGLISESGGSSPSKASAAEGLKKTPH